MCLFGDVMELQNQGKKPEEIDWTSYVYGSLAGTYAWVIILAFLTNSPGSENAPWFVWAILGTYIVLFNTFPYVMYN